MLSHLILTSLSWECIQGEVTRSQEILLFQAPTIWLQSWKTHRARNPLDRHFCKQGRSRESDICSATLIRSHIHSLLSLHLQNWRDGWPVCLTTSLSDLIWPWTPVASFHTPQILIQTITMSGWLCLRERNTGILKSTFNTDHLSSSPHPPTSGLN